MTLQTHKSLKASAGLKTFNLDFDKVFPEPGFRHAKTRDEIHNIHGLNNESIHLKYINKYVDSYGIDIRNVKFKVEGTIDLSVENSPPSTPLHQLPVIFHTIDGDFLCNNNRFETFDYRFPSTVNGSFFCNGNRQLKSTKNIPVTRFTISLQNTRITKLEDLSHQSLHNFSIASSKISSFEGSPKYIDNHYNARDCVITSLVDVHHHLKYCESLDLTGNPIVEGGIGLLLVSGIKNYFYSEDLVRHPNNPPKAIKAMQIIKKYIKQGKAGLLTCQDELIEAGLEQYAKL